MAYITATVILVLIAIVIIGGIINSAEQSSLDKDDWDDDF